MITCWEITLCPPPPPSVFQGMLRPLFDSTIHSSLRGRSTTELSGKYTYIDYLKNRGYTTKSNLIVHYCSILGYKQYKEYFNLHIHHEYKYYSSSSLKEITEMGGGGGPELFISEITGSVLHYLVPNYRSNVMVCSTQTLAQIKP